MSLYEAQAGPSKPRAQAVGKKGDKSSNVSASSFLGLKADLAQRQDELKRKSGSERAESTTSDRRLPAYLRPDSSVARSKHSKSTSARGSGRSTSSWANTPSAQLDAARAALEKKAAIYEKLKKGKHAGMDDAMVADTLVDWARRAEEEEDETSEEEESDHGTVERELDDEDPLIEYVDEFGRSRMLPRSEVPRDWLRAREREQDEGGEEDEAIYGPATHFPVYRPPSPRRASPSAPVKRFDARHEVRAKPAGFYQFSANEASRRKEMEQLMEIRRETERLRRERSGGVESDEEREGQGVPRSAAQARMEERRKVVEEKRQEILNRRAQRRKPGPTQTPPSTAILDIPTRT